MKNFNMINTEIFNNFSTSLQKKKIKKLKIIWCSKTLMKNIKNFIINIKIKKKN